VTAYEHCQAAPKNYDPSLDPSNSSSNGNDAVEKIIASPRPIRTVAAIVALCFVAASRADDWPQWRGPDRDAIWHEAGLLQSFPPGGLKILWRAPVGAGFSSPCVAQGRVYVTD